MEENDQDINHGIDSVTVFYHSGHGGMDNQGNFSFPVYNNNQGDRIYSTQMKLGNEKVRYLFWSTCLSCRVSDGHTPIRTWAKANRGFRMLFGYDTTSYDNPNYGKKFWTNRMNFLKSNSYAFLDASWYISHNQSPVAVACGATKEEAQNRVYKERSFDPSTVSHTWWSWLFYNKVKDVNSIKNNLLPSKLLVAEIEAQTVDTEYVQRILNKYNLKMEQTQDLPPDNDFFYMKNGDSYIVFENDGSYEIQFKAIDLENKEKISIEKAIEIAKNYIKKIGINEEDLAIDCIRLTEMGGGKFDKGEVIESIEPFVIETSIQFSQVINKLSVILPGKGEFLVTIDNNGDIVKVRNSMKKIIKFIDKRDNTISMNPEKSIANIWEEQYLKYWNDKSIKYDEIPGSYEVGYFIKDNKAILVAKKDFKVIFEDGFCKNYSIQASLIE